MPVILTYAMFGQRARVLGRLTLVGLALLTLAASFTWLAWLLVVSLVVGVRHPPVVRPDEPLGAARGWVCAATFVVAVLCFPSRHLSSQSSKLPGSTLGR